MMEPELISALSERLLAMADDELILAHRDSEWTGHAPILEEDIAFANIALDELGHASIWYGLRESITGESADGLVFFREPGDFRNVQLVESPKGDWAYSMVRQYLFDAAESIMLPHLTMSAYRPLAEAATKIQREEVYHLRHTSLWLKRLGLGTEESHARTQQALDATWPYARQLFVPMGGDDQLIEAGIVPPLDLVQREWEAFVRPFLTECGLLLPEETLPKRDISRGEHTESLMDLLSEMQAVARMDPEAEW